MKIQEHFDLHGRVALVTGGAGLYGRQVVEALAEAGAKTLMASRDVEKPRQHAEIFQNAGLDVAAMQFDQASPQSIEQLLHRIVGDFGGVDILVNNAVIRTMTDWSGPVEQFARSMETNATGVFAITRAFGEHMATRGHGSVINVASMQGIIGPDYTLYEGLNWGVAPDYFFHKGGMIQLTRFAAAKLGPQGVRVNAILPGGFFNNQDATFVTRYNARTFLGRMANETDLKGVVVLLASDASAYITGAAIPVDGGYTAK
jgi:NAD(P)-dependent dehydrogenase (short-subunit alcohol dehydrogenase family)